jgi:alpha-ketoglutaric semialdehyde dehydrogenase
MNPLPETLQGRSFIGATPFAAEGEIFFGIDPSTGENLPTAFYAAGAAEASAAAELAGRAFPVYRKTSGAERGKFLRTIADNLEALTEALVARVQRETALPEARCRGELARTTGQLRLFAGLVEEGSWCGARIDHGDPDRKPLPKPDTRFMLQGLGPVAVFGPANFPLAFGAAGGDTASALAAGCPVVVKAHSSHPGTSELCARAILRAAHTCGLPDGVFSLLFGSGGELGPALVTHPHIKAVGFTGSEKAGRSLFDLAARRPDPIPVFAEMGSLNPVFILPRALRERGEEIAAGLHASVTLGAGQFCTKPGLVVTQQSEAAVGFVSRFEERMTQTDAAVLLNRGTLDSYRAGLQRLADASGCAAPAEAAPWRAAPAVFRSTVATFQREPGLREEIFGPATVLLSADNRDEVIAFARSLTGHLTATVHGTDEDFAEYRELIEILETRAGRLVFNGFPTGVEVCSSMNHSGPYPASTDVRFTSVGTAAILRFVRPVCYQNCPDSALPAELQEANPLHIRRLVDNAWSAPA